MQGEPTDGPYYPLTIRLQPRPALLVAILAAHLVAGAVLLFMRLPLFATLPLLLLVLASALRAAWAQAQKRGLSLVLADDGALRLCRESRGSQDAIDAWGRVLPSAVLFPAVLWFGLIWTAPDGRCRRLRLMLIAAEVRDGGGDVHGAQWRRLRTWLRHCATAPTPPPFPPSSGE